MRAALGIAGGERSGSVGAGGEQTVAGARRCFAITRFRLGSTHVLHGEIARDARNTIAASTRRIGGRSEKGRGKRTGDELYLDAKLRGCGIWTERDGTAVAQSSSSTMAAASV